MSAIQPPGNTKVELPPPLTVSSVHVNAGPVVPVGTRLSPPAHPASHPVGSAGALAKAPAHQAPHRQSVGPAQATIQPFTVTTTGQVVQYTFLDLIAPRFEALRKEVQTLLTPSPRSEGDRLTVKDRLQVLTLLGDLLGPDERREVRHQTSRAATLGYVDGILALHAEEAAGQRHTVPEQIGILGRRLALTAPQMQQVLAAMQADGRYDVSKIVQRALTHRSTFAINTYLAHALATDSQLQHALRQKQGGIWKLQGPTFTLTMLSFLGAEQLADCLAIHDPSERFAFVVGLTHMTGGPTEKIGHLLGRRLAGESALVDLTTISTKNGVTTVSFRMRGPLHKSLFAAVSESLLGKGAWQAGNVLRFAGHQGHLLVTAPLRMGNDLVLSEVIDALMVGSFGEKYPGRSIVHMGSMFAGGAVNQFTAHMPRFARSGGAWSHFLHRTTPGLLTRAFGYVYAAGFFLGLASMATRRAVRGAEADAFAVRAHEVGSLVHIGGIASAIREFGVDFGFLDAVANDDFPGISDALDFAESHMVTRGQLDARETARGIRTLLAAVGRTTARSAADNLRSTLQHTIAMGAIQTPYATLATLLQQESHTVTIPNWLIHYDPTHEDDYAVLRQLYMGRIDHPEARRVAALFTENFLRTPPDHRTQAPAHTPVPETPDPKEPLFMRWTGEEGAGAFGPPMPPAAPAEKERILVSEAALMEWLGGEGAILEKRRQYISGSLVELQFSLAALGVPTITLQALSALQHDQATDGVDVVTLEHLRGVVQFVGQAHAHQLIDADGTIRADTRYYQSLEWYTRALAQTGDSAQRQQLRNWVVQRNAALQAALHDESAPAGATQRIVTELFLVAPLVFEEGSLLLDNVRMGIRTAQARGIEPDPRADAARDAAAAYWFEYARRNIARDLQARAPRGITYRFGKQYRPDASPPAAPADAAPPGHWISPLVQRVRDGAKQVVAKAGTDGTPKLLTNPWWDTVRQHLTPTTRVHPMQHAAVAHRYDLHGIATDLHWQATIDALDATLRRLRDARTFGLEAVYNDPDSSVREQLYGATFETESTLAGDLETAEKARARLDTTRLNGALADVPRSVRLATHYAVRALPHVPLDETTGVPSVEALAGMAGPLLLQSETQDKELRALHRLSEMRRKARLGHHRLLTGVEQGDPNAPPPPYQAQRLREVQELHDRLRAHYAMAYVSAVATGAHTEGQQIAALREHFSTGDEGRFAAHEIQNAYIAYRQGGLEDAFGLTALFDSAGRIRDPKALVTWLRPSATEAAKRSAIDEWQRARATDTPLPVRIDAGLRALRLSEFVASWNETDILDLLQQIGQLKTFVEQMRVAQSADSSAIEAAPPPPHTVQYWARELRDMESRILDRAERFAITTWGDSSTNPHFSPDVRRADIDRGARAFFGQSGHQPQ